MRERSVETPGEHPQRVMRMRTSEEPSENIITTLTQNHPELALECCQLEPANHTPSTTLIQVHQLLQNFLFVQKTICRTNRTR